MSYSAFIPKLFSVDKKSPHLYLYKQCPTPDPYIRFLVTYDTRVFGPPFIFSCGHELRERMCVRNRQKMTGTVHSMKAFYLNAGGEPSGIGTERESTRILKVKG